MRQLETRLSELRRFMLPAKFDDTGSYSDRVFDRARGYRLLAHAELEACIEDLVTHTVNSAFKAWAFDRQPRQCLLALLAYHDGQLGGVPEAISVSGGASEMPLRSRVKKARDQYVTWVKMKNNGIREANVLRLLLPVGILESDLDGAWLQRLDAFGSARGDTAHQAQRTQQPPDPRQEYETVTAIVNELRKLDARLSVLAR